MSAKPTQAVLAVHGGAGTLSGGRLPTSQRTGYARGLASALRIGHGILDRQGSALDAVTEAVAVLEDNAQFNAGRGAVLCSDGSIELSASVMDGADLAVGGVAGLKRTKNPVRAARLFMHHSHTLIWGAQVEDRARRHGLEMVEPDYFETPERRIQWQKLRASDDVRLDHDGDGPHGTVGAVALDCRGNLAAATSTGGMTNQMPGRIPDSAVIGAATWAQNRLCALSTTGKGDAFSRIVFARRVADLMALASLAPDQAARQTLEAVRALSGDGGCIVLDSQGACHMPYNTGHMLRGIVRGDGIPHIAVDSAHLAPFAR